MIFRQIPHDDLGCASYLIGDDDAGVAAVVDPKFEIDEYLELARYMGVSIEHILETHNHADHVSGHGKLAAATGATIHINRAAGAGYEHEPFGDGFELELGALAVRAIHTPGHRPEHTAFALVDRSRGEEPWALLSGDSLFVNDVARPDLAIDKEEGAQAIFRSLHERILSLPPETEVWPGHLGGSLCGGPAMDMKPSSTLAYERAHNPMLQVDDEQEFVAQAVGSLGPQPPNFEAIVALNRGELADRGGRGHAAHPAPGRAQALAGRAAGRRADRPPVRRRPHPARDRHPAVQAGFGTRLAWLADRDQEIVLVGRDDGDARRAAKLALSVGIRRFGGFLHGGMTEWRREQRPVERIERLELDDLAGRLESEPQTHRRVEVRLADRSDCRSTPSTCSWLTPARPPPPSCSAPPPALGRVTPRANWRATWRASREVPAHRRCLFGLQNRQGVAVPRLDGSIPSPLRRAKGLHVGVFSGPGSVSRPGASLSGRTPKSPCAATLDDRKTIARNADARAESTPPRAALAGDARYTVEACRVLSEWAELMHGRREWMPPGGDPAQLLVGPWEPEGTRSRRGLPQGWPTTNPKGAFRAGSPTLRSVCRLNVN